MPQLCGVCAGEEEQDLLPLLAFCHVGCSEKGFAPSSALIYVVRPARGTSLPILAS